jgi:hypothetical protein
MLTFMGYNLRKLFRYFNGTQKSLYWKAPADLEAETFKKPSVKRLVNKAKKKKKKSVNEQAKTSYKHKKKRLFNFRIQPEVFLQPLSFFIRCISSLPAYM